MNKTLKITLISVGALLGVVLLVALIACWLVFTPARLTSLVQKYAPNFITCELKLDKADLTLFKSFPKLGVRIDNMLLINPIDNPDISDTLAYIDECVLSVDIKKIIKDKQIIIDECRLYNGAANVFFNADGESNLDIFPPSETDEVEVPEEEAIFDYSIDLTLLKLEDLSVTYADMSLGLMADIDGIDMSLKGKMHDDVIVGNLKLSLESLAYKQNSDDLSMDVSISGLAANGDVDIVGEIIKADVDLSSSALVYESMGQYAELNAMNFKYKGDINDFDLLNSTVEMSVDDLSFLMDNEKLLDKADIAMISPLKLNLNSLDVEMGASQLAFNSILLDFIGNVSLPDEGIYVDIDAKTNTLIIEELIELVPVSMREEMLAGITVGGKMQLDIEAEGLYNDNSMPVVNAELSLNEANVDMPELLPYPLSNINTSLKADVNLNDKTNVVLNHLNANLNNTSFKLSGTINDVLNKMYCKLKINADADLNDLQSFIPQGIKAEGDINLSVDAEFNNDLIANMDLNSAKVKGELSWNNMNVIYQDSIKVNADNLGVSLIMPNPSSLEIINDFIESLAVVTINGNNLDAQVSDMIAATLKDYNMEVQMSNVLDEDAALAVSADYSFERIDATMDGMKFFSNNPSGYVAMLTEKDSNNASYMASYDGDSLLFTMDETMNFVTETLGLKVTADYDDEQQDMLLQWNPHANIKFDNAQLAMSDMAFPVYIPSIDFKYDTAGIEINDSRVLFGDSDFNLQGLITNVDAFIRKEGLLKGTLDFTSEYTDVNQIMEAFSGMGDTTTVVEEEIVEVDSVDAEAESESEPFMVPYGINFTLNTNIKNAVAGNMNIRDVKGGLTVKDGTLVLQEMGFTSDVAKMMLTAMYQSPRRNHLYLGFDLHLLEIDIAEMMNIMPDLDTLVPMLNSFAGRAEFHFAAETNLKSNYELKLSTLKGALSIRGNDLVILDNETFKKISRILMFKDKKHNMIDELAVEITAFKSEIDVYPTYIAIDKYRAVVGGRHKLDMTFDYSLGVTNPWPFRRLGIGLKGDLNDIDYDLYWKKNVDAVKLKGNKQDVHLVEQSLRLKNIIYESLKD